MKTIKNIKKNSIIILLVTLIILYILLKDNFSEIVKTLSTMNLFFVLIAILFYFIYIILRAYIIYKSVDDKKKLTFKEAIKHNIITQFFNGITPFSTGGQPMEIYMLTEHNISVAKATSVTIINFIFYQTALVIYGIIVVIYNMIFNLFPKATMLNNLVTLGFIVNILVIVVLYIVTLSKKMTKKTLNSIIDILYRLKIVKNKEKQKERFEQKLDDFHDSAKILRKNRRLFIEGILINFLSLSFFYAIPLFIAYGFNDFTSLNLLQAITASAYIYIMGSFVPIPGASGGIEYGFIKFFGNFFKTVALNTLLLVWRFITYYLGMIVGAILLSIEKKGD